VLSFPVNAAARLVFLASRSAHTTSLYFKTYTGSQSRSGSSSGCMCVLSPWRRTTVPERTVPSSIQPSVRITVPFHLANSSALLVLSTRSTAVDRRPCVSGGHSSGLELSTDASRVQNVFWQTIVHIKL